MKKLFGYPEFDKNGEKILTTYNNEYSDMMMDIRVYRLEAGETREFMRKDEEMAVLLLSGNIVFAWEGNREKADRKDVFTEGPWCVHVCTGTSVSVTAESPSEILVQCTKNKKEFSAKLYRPKDAPWVYSCKGKFGDVARRRVSTIFDYETAPYSKWYWARSSTTEVTGRAICPTGIRSQRHITSSLTGRRDSEPALWVTMSLRARTAASRQYREVSFIPRLLRRGFRCIPAG